MVAGAGKTYLSLINSSFAHYLQKCRLMNNVHELLSSPFVLISRKEIFLAQSLVRVVKSSPIAPCLKCPKKNDKSQKGL